MKQILIARSGVKLVDWSIQDKHPWSPDERRRFWEAVHVRGDYESIWSVTEEEHMLDQIAAALKLSGSEVARALIPGAGTRTLLERHLVDEFPGLSIVATDFPEVARKASSTFQHPRVEYIARDSTDLGWKDEFDFVLPVNSTVSERHSENIQMLDSMLEALRPNGRLVGLFPTVIATLDIASVMRSQAQFKRVDLERSSVCESDGVEQIFYSPLRLRQLCREVGFSLERMEIVFFESDRARQESSAHYSIDADADLVVYELLVTARRAVA